MHLFTNQDMAKALSTGTMASGGRLNREQQRRFVRHMLNYSQMLAPGSGVRTRPVAQAQGQIEQLFMHGPVTLPASSVFSTDGFGAGSGENGEGGLSNATVLTSLYDVTHDKFGLRLYNCVKMASRKAWSTEFLRENVEGRTIEGSLRADFLPRIATDFEDLAINGDAGLLHTSFIDSKSPRGALLKANNGWDVLSDTGVPVDAAGEFLSASFWEAALKKMPRWMLRERRNLRWVCNDDVLQDWTTLLSQRQDGLGAGAIQGQVVNPMGIPFLISSLWRSDKAITVTEAKAGRIDGQRPGPFVFVKDASDLIILNIDGKGALTIDISAGGGGVPANTGSFLLTTTEVCAVLNAALVADANHGAAYGAVARPNAVNDHIILQSPSAGAGKDVAVTVPATPCLDLLGLGADNDDGLFDGALTGSGAALGANTFQEGTSIILTDPANFAWVVITADQGADQMGVRSYSAFNKDRDRTEMIVYAYTDAILENPQALVKVKNLRIRPVGAL